MDYSGFQLPIIRETSGSQSSLCMLIYGKCPSNHAIHSLYTHKAAKYLQGISCGKSGTALWKATAPPAGRVSGS